MFLQYWNSEVYFGKRLLFKKKKLRDWRFLANTNYQITALFSGEIYKASSAVIPKAS